MSGLFEPGQIDIDPTAEALRPIRDLLGQMLEQRIRGGVPPSDPVFSGLANPVEQLFPGSSLNPTQGSAGFNPPPSSPSTKDESPSFEPFEPGGGFRKPNEDEDSTPLNFLFNPATIKPKSSNNRGPFGSDSEDFGPFQEPETDGVVSSGSRLDQSFEPQFNLSNFFDSSGTQGSDPFNLQQFGGPFSAPLTGGQLDALAGFRQLFSSAPGAQAQSAESQLERGLSGDPALAQGQSQTNQTVRTADPFLEQVFGGNSGIQFLRHGGEINEEDDTVVGESGPELIPAGTNQVIPLLPPPPTAAIPPPAAAIPPPPAAVAPAPVSSTDFARFTGPLVNAQVGSGPSGTAPSDRVRQEQLSARDDQQQQQQPGAAGFADSIFPVLGDFQKSLQEALGAPSFDLTETFKLGEDIFKSDLDQQLARVKEEASRFGLNPGSTDRNRGLIETGSNALGKFRLGQQDIARQAFDSSEGRRIDALNAGGRSGDFLNLPFDRLEQFFDLENKGRGIADQDIQRRMQEFQRTQGGGLDQILAALSGTPLQNTAFGPSGFGQFTDLLSSVSGFFDPTSHKPGG